MFKLNRLWNISICDERFAMREIPQEKLGRSSHFKSDKKAETKLIALFDKSVKHLLIETYGIDCFLETCEGLLFEIGYTKYTYIVGWLLSFGDKVKVLEPLEIAEHIQTTAKIILTLYS